jgi:hypothetical protein
MGQLRTTDEEIVTAFLAIAAAQVARQDVEQWFAQRVVFKVAAGNMWIGVAQAGYSFKEELPIFLLIFLLPAAAAVFIKWQCP